MHNLTRVFIHFDFFYGFYFQALRYIYVTPIIFFNDLRFEIFAVSDPSMYPLVVLTRRVFKLYNFQALYNLAPWRLSVDCRE